MKVDITSTERGLLSFLLAKIHKTDPDLIVVRLTFIDHYECSFMVCYIYIYTRNYNNAVCPSWPMMTIMSRFCKINGENSFRKVIKEPFY